MLHLLVDSTLGDISKLIYPISGEIFADSENSDEIYDEVAHRQTDSG